MGKIMKNGVVYSGNNTVEVTQQEYDTLTQAQKENGTIYFVTDGVPTQADYSETSYSTTSLNHLETASVTVYKRGKYGIVYIGAKNTSSALAVGSTAAFTIQNFPETVAYSNGIGFSGGTGIIGRVSPNGDVALRVIGTAWTQGWDCGITVPVIFK